MALEITARFDGLTWGELRKLVIIAADQPDDEEVLYAYDEGAYEATGILVFTTANDLAQRGGLICVRIRSIKPDFWRSEDTARLDWETRLLFIGLWSYVDDNGVGRDVERLIVADLFPLDDDPRDTLAKVSRGLATLSEANLIVRYTFDGKPYLYVTGWRHQKIDKPAKARYPRPDDVENGWETGGSGDSPF